MNGCLIWDEGFNVTGDFSLLDISIFSLKIVKL